MASLAFSSVAWPSAVGVILGAVLGFTLAYVLIDRVIRAQVETPQPTAVRRLASACCLLWGLVLPLAMAVAGLVWGVGSGVGSVVEGPVSTTVRETTHTWLIAANTLGVGVLKRLPLAKRLTERELLSVVQAAPDVIADALDQDRVGAVWQKATGAPMPPQLAAVLRHEFKALTSHHGEWLHPAVERLRARAKEAGTSGPDRPGSDRGDGGAAGVPRRGDDDPFEGPAGCAPGRSAGARARGAARRWAAARVAAAAGCAR